MRIAIRNRHSKLRPLIASGLFSEVVTGEKILWYIIMSLLYKQRSQRCSRSELRPRHLSPVRPYARGFGTHAFANYTAKLWNSLPVSVCCAGLVPAPRKILKTHYLNHPSRPQKFNHDNSPCPRSQHYPGIELDCPRL